MSHVLDEFQRIITESNIPAQDQNDILVVLPSLPEKAISALNEIFSRDPETVAEFNKSFKSKVRALTNQDDKEWEDILRKEREQIDGIGVGGNELAGDSDMEKEDAFN
ncbi:hypothetical protein KKB43_00915 [Patescibacteria group bacterium]|nr:hypothetical protein [Patescibacteria group bacterium]MBU4142302.1 hypothetical protein [Patescibacteria group bacterium]MBU4338915.1 hypothetical protein [Patescibacteria group bacterium]MBU4579560.1 hypothetical protein [Patescibacteria group bacterium]